MPSIGEKLAANQAALAGVSQVGVDAITASLFSGSVLLRCFCLGSNWEMSLTIRYPFLPNFFLRLGIDLRSSTY